MIFLQVFKMKESTYPNRVGDELNLKTCQKAIFSTAKWGFERSLIFCFLLPCLLAAESPILLISQNRELKKEKAVSPALVKETCSSGRFETDLSFLIWQAQEDGLEFAAKNSPRFPLSANTPTDISASLSTVDFSWEPAFKFLLGYHFDNPSWDFNTRWTGYYSHSNRSISDSLSDAGAGILPLWIPPQAALATFPVYSKAKSSLILQMNTFDIELAYTGGISPAFFLKLHGGLKAILINQTFRAKYTGGASDGPNQMLDSNAHAKSKCQGIGPRVGFGSRWALPKGWSLIAEAAGAFALSEMRTVRKDHSIGTISGVPQEIAIHFHENFWVWRPLLEGKAGVRWEHCFGCEKNRILNLELAYEIQEYWEQNIFVRYGDSAIFYAPYNSRGNLTLQGFSFTLALGY